VVIPSNISTGSATLNAACSNGTTFSSAVNIGPVAVNSFAFNPSPAPGTYTVISGNCTNVTGDANGTVAFGIMRYGAVSALSATGNVTNGSGFFSSSVFFPSNEGSDPAVLVVTCPNGSTFSNVIMLGATVANPIPVGGVAAGSGPQDAAKFPVAAGILLVTGLFGLYAVTRKNSYAQK
jgi:hypothetical protein